MSTNLGKSLENRGSPELIQVFHQRDSRGGFAKPFSFSYHSVPFEVREIFWTISARSTIRGMHVQVAPSAAAKLVWVSAGSICDVLVDLRNLETFGQIWEYELSADIGTALYVPEGFGHGFQALEENTIVNYGTSCEFDPACDTGVDADSIGFNWPLTKPIRSVRDVSLLSLADFRQKHEGGL